MKMKVVRLATIAKAINEKCPGFTAFVDVGYYNTDRKIVGTHFIHKGKGRRGNRLTVRDRTGKVVLEHDSSDPWRTNSDAMEKVERLWGRIWEPGVSLHQTRKAGIVSTHKLLKSGRVSIPNSTFRAKPHRVKK
jgi:hypothetical protein